MTEKLMLTIIGLLVFWFFYHNYKLNSIEESLRGSIQLNNNALQAIVQQEAGMIKSKVESEVKNIPSNIDRYNLNKKDCQKLSKLNLNDGRYDVPEDYCMRVYWW